MLETSVSLVLMIAELMAAECIFALRLKRKSLFFLRLIGAFVVILEAVFFMVLIFYRSTDILFSYGGASEWKESLFKFFLYVTAFVMTILGMKFCYDDSVWVIMFYCSGAYATQHLAKNVASLISFFTVGEDGWAYWLIEAAMCAAACALAYSLFIRGRALPDNGRSVRRKVILSFVVIFVCVGLSRITVDNATRGVISFIAETIYSVVCCALVLVVLSDINKMDRMSDDLTATREILDREREQYMLSKEKTELINMKYHDLKHMLGKLCEGWSDEQLLKIEDALMVYGASVRTGNDVLDVILTDKSLLCEKNSISLTCSCNGETLAFMDECDLYSLFGNALSNAIESAEKVEDKSRRSIVVDVRSVGGIISIHIENYYAEQPVIVDGLPVTDKSGPTHGYGMKSMEYITRQYGGHMTVTASGGRFCLDIIFPPSAGRRRKDGGKA